SSPRTRGGRGAGPSATAEVAGGEPGPALEGSREVGRVRVSQRARDVADLPAGVAQHLPGRLETDLLDDARVRQARPVQPALERAGARPHRVGDAPDVDGATREQHADDLPHAAIEVASRGVPRWRMSTSHLVTDRGGSGPGRTRWCTSPAAVSCHSVPRG